MRLFSFILLFLSTQIMAQTELPDYEDILLPDEKLNMTLINQMLTSKEGVSAAEVEGDWQILKGRMNTSFSKEEDNTYMDFEAWEDIVMSFYDEGYFFLDGIIDLEGTWELQSENTVLNIKKEIGKRTDEEFHRVFIDEDIMHSIIKEDSVVIYMVLQKIEEKNFVDYFMSNALTTANNFYLNISLYYECIEKDVFQPQLADTELNELKESLDNTIFDYKTMIETFELEEEDIDKLNEVILVLMMENRMLNILIEYNEGRTKQLKEDFELRRSQSWHSLVTLLK